MILTLNPLPISSYNPFAAAWRALCAAVMHQGNTSTNPMHTVGILDKGETLALQSPVGYSIECMEGCVWVTLDGDTRDVVICSGQTYWPDRNSRALVHALDKSQVSVSLPA